MQRLKLIAKGLAGLVITAILIVALFSPYVIVEAFALTNEKPQQPETDDQNYWTIKQVAPGVIAIGELQFYQLNWHYLITGRDRAVLFDTGTGLQGLRDFVETLTDLPITAMVSHLHYDHVGNLQQFDDVAMIDIPAVRSQISGDVLEIGRYQHLGFIDGITSQPIQVSSWLQDDATIDLGDRQLVVYSVPGHTPDSIVLHDPANALLFTGDTVYPGNLFAMLPGASRSDYVASTKKLIDILPEGTRLLAGHADEDDPERLPELTVATLVHLHERLAAAESGKIAYEGGFPRTLVIEDGIGLITGFSWANR